LARCSKLVGENKAIPLEQGDILGQRSIREGQDDDGLDGDGRDEIGEMVMGEMR